MAKRFRPRLYLKSNLKQVASDALMDLRTDKHHKPIDEIRRMGREKIPAISTAVKINEIGRFWSVMELGKNKQDRLKVLLPFFHEQRLTQVVIPIISVTSRISLRALDWLVINYSKKHKIALVNNKTHLLQVYDDYRAWLRYWKRGLFDAFRRGPRIYFEHNGFHYSTTVAQLNFLYWCEKTGILHYANAHLAEIESDMNLRINECRKEKERLVKAGKKRKRCELSKTPSVKCLVYNVPVTIHF